MSKVYQYVTDRIIADLKKDIAPWSAPWSIGGPIPINWTSARQYSGINRLLLKPGGQFLTYNQIAAKNGKINKDATPYMVVFWKVWKKEDEKGIEQNIPVCRYYKVWELEQTTLASERRTIPAYSPETQIELIETILADPRLPTPTYGASEASYSISTDHIELPHRTDFTSTEHFYATAFHELIHATKHKTRLDRNKINRVMEELVAEIGSAFLLQHFNIYLPVADNISAYCASWLENIANTNDPRFIITAASLAQKAVDYILTDTIIPGEESA